MTRSRAIGLFGLSFAGMALAGCASAIQPTPVPGPLLPASPAPTPTPTLAPAPSPTPTPSLTPTPDPYDGLTIDSLRRRSYGSQGLTVEQQSRIAYGLTRATFDYESDGLQVHAFVDIPEGQGPFPVVLVLHGYIDPEVYNTLTYTAHYATDFARRGFIAVHPNYRNYPPSDAGPNLFRVGYAVDVLNLAALIRSEAGRPGLFERADGEAIGLFGHSMGGGIALRSITVSDEIDAAVLYGAMSGNERWNFEKIQEWSDGERGIDELGVPEADLERISPINFLEGLQAPVSIHHGAADELVPPEWSDDLCARLKALDKPVECFSYPGQPHTFYGEGDAQLIQRAADFFGRYLGP